MESFENTEIKKIAVDVLKTGIIDCDMEGIRHVKTLPCLSVVQVLSGKYEIGLDNSPLQTAEEGGVFVAPAHCVQEIIHRNGKNNTFKSHWVFMDVTINGVYRFEDLFMPTLILPVEENKAVQKYIDEIINAKTLCQKNAAAYMLFDIVLNHSEHIESLNPIRLKLKNYVLSHFCEKITAAQLAREAICSLSQLYRLTEKFFGMSPANYVNSIRLQNAALLLSKKDVSISQVAFDCGFDDAAYFSKLFKKNYLVSPLSYRNNVSK